MSQTDTLHRHVIKASELRVGDRRQIGRYISPVISLRPYRSGVTGEEDHRYLVVDGIVPPLCADDEVTVWRP